MMLEPRAGLLLRRVCDSLEATAADPRQQRAALWVLRDLAKRIDDHAQAVQQDIAEMQASLRALGLVPGETHMQLQQQLQDAARALRGEPDPQRILRAVYVTMLERERSLLGEPGGNPSLKSGAIPS